MLTLKKNYASLESGSGNLYELSDEDIRKVHEVLLEIYDDIFTYCQKYGLKLIAGGGTALGAVRHSGFIPWDDDMDLNLTREDYKKFISYFEDELGHKYDLLAPGYKRGASCFLMRVLKKDSTFLNMIDESSPYPTGIYIDITPIDYAPNRKEFQIIKGIIADVLRFVSYSVYWHQYKSKSLKEFMTNSEGKMYYKLRMLTGAICSFTSAEKWFKFFDNYIQGKKSNYVTVAAGRNRYCGELYSVNTFFPLKKAVFDNRTVYVYNDIDVYLKGLYGDYMKIPDPKDREKHLWLCLDFCKSRGKLI